MLHYIGAGGRYQCAAQGSAIDNLVLERSEDARLHLAAAGSGDLTTAGEPQADPRVDGLTNSVPYDCPGCCLKARESFPFRYVRAMQNDRGAEAPAGCLPSFSAACEGCASLA